MSIVTAVRFTLRDAFIRCPITDRPGDAARVAAKWLAVAALVAAYAVLAASLEYSVTHEMIRGLGSISSEVATATAVSVVVFGIAVAWNVRTVAFVCAVVAAGVFGNAALRLGIISVGVPQLPSPADSGSIADLFSTGNAFVQQVTDAFDPALVVATFHLHALLAMSTDATPVPVLIAAWIVVALALLAWGVQGDGRQ